MYMASKIATVKPTCVGPDQKKLPNRLVKAWKWWKSDDYISIPYWADPVTMLLEPEAALC